MHWTERMVVVLHKSYYLPLYRFLSTSLILGWCERRFVPVNISTELLVLVSVLAVRK
jgi:hypothetical protein